MVTKTAPVRTPAMVLMLLVLMSMMLMVLVLLKWLPQIHLHGIPLMA
jgi:hypothetical protein